MTVREIIIAHLKSIGAEGLCCEGCYCGLEDYDYPLLCCERIPDYCVPAKRTEKYHEIYEEMK